MYKRVISILILLLLFLLPQRSKAIDTTSTKFFPMQIGNVYVYVYASSDFRSRTAPLYTRAEIINIDTIMGQIYYQFVGFPRRIGGWLRTDTITGSLYKYDSSNSCFKYYFEDFVDSLSSHTGDTISFCNYHPDERTVCYNETTLNVFGQVFEFKVFQFEHFSSVHIIESWGYLKNIGPYNFYFAILGWGGGWSAYTLKGCVINGIVYGDTSLTNVKNISTVTPSNFKLFQNYPNPFNPFTNIKFNIPKSSHVTLNVYNILGKELTTLVNEKVNAGSYEVKWNASNYTSGVYFYRLVADDFVDTKRMLLVK